MKRRVTLQSTDGKPFRIISVGHDAITKIRPSDGGGFPSPASNRHALELFLEVPREPTSTFLAGSVPSSSTVGITRKCLFLGRSSSERGRRNPRARADEMPLFGSRTKLFE